MSSFRLILNMIDGGRLWINVAHIIKMQKTPDGRYFIYLVNGETYEVDHRTASMVENYFEEG